MLGHSDSETVARMLNEGMQRRGAGAAQKGWTVADPRLNAVVIFGAKAYKDDMLRLVRQQVGRPQAAFAALAPVPLGAHQLPFPAASGLTISLRKCRLVFKRLHRRRSPPHVQEDHPPGASVMMRLTRRQRADIVSSGVCSLLLTEPGKRQVPDAAGGGL